jgi:hypothetical protein
VHTYLNTDIDAVILGDYVVESKVNNCRI